MKKYLEYYQHPANSSQDPRHKALRVRFGWEGAGRYYALLDLIASADNCKLDLSKSFNISSAASDLSMTLDQFNEFIEFLCSEDCQLLICENNHVTTPEIQETFTKVMYDREKARERKTKAGGSKPENSDSSDEDSKSSPELSKKVKQSKGKENKDNESASADFVDELILIFQHEFKKSRGIDYESEPETRSKYMKNGKDRKNMAQLLKIFKSKNPDMDSDGIKKLFTGFFKDALLIDNQFYADISISKLNSHLNGYKQSINNLRKDRRNQKSGPSRNGSHSSKSEENIQAAKEFLSNSD